MSSAGPSNKRLKQTMLNFGSKASFSFDRPCTPYTPLVPKAGGIVPHTPCCAAHEFGGTRASRQYGDMCISRTFFIFLQEISRKALQKKILNNFKRLMAKMFHSR